MLDTRDIVDHGLETLIVLELHCSSLQLSNERVLDALFTQHLVP